jgi:hypothetical protein
MGGCIFHVAKKTAPEVMVSSGKWQVLGNV